MSEDTALATAKNGADRLVLAEVHSRLDWVSVPSVLIGYMQGFIKDGIIQDYRFTNLEIKVNGTWYKRP